jgi:hypothetical protein
MAPKKSTMTAGVKRTGKNACATKGGDLDAPPRRVRAASAGEVKAQLVKTASEGSCLALRASSGSGAGASKPAKRRAPRNHRGLAKAVFAKSNMVTIGQELLQSKSATVKARVWETLVHYALGEFAPAGGEAAPALEIIWDMPGPVREPR